MELKQYARFVRHWWYLLALFGAIGFGIGLIMSAKPPMYSATTTLMIGNRPTRATPNTDSLRANATLSKTYSALMTTQPVMAEVVRNLGLNMSPGQLVSQIEVRYIDDTDLIKLTAQALDKEQSVAIANETVAAFNRQASTILSNPYALSIDAVRVVEEAQTGKLVPSDTFRNALLATVLGLLLAIGLGSLIDYFDDRVKNSETVTRLVNLPTLANIQHIRGGNQPAKLVTVAEPSSATAEAFRMIRSQIAPTGSDVHSLVVTSGNRQEGKSTIAANLAVAMAQTGLRVILVDADLRRPTLHGFFNRTNQRGLTTALARQRGDSLATHLINTDVERLQLLPSGPLPTNPTEVLGTPRFAELITDLKAQADLVVIDSPALLAVVDPLLLTQTGAAAIVVAQAKATRSATLTKAVAQLQQANTRILGVVLNEAAQTQEARNTYHDGGKGIRTFNMTTQTQPSIATADGAEIVERAPAREQR